MSESELAYNANGEPFSVPARVTGWRVRRLRGGRGAPELVYDRDGRPLMLGLDAGLDDLREAVDVSGRYRLDPIDDDGKPVEGVPSGYVHVMLAERNAAPREEPLPANLTSVDHALREIVRANLELARCNSELAKTVVSRQPDVMTSTAEILRAADGAGLPRREPAAGWDDDDDESAVDGDTAPPASTLEAIVNQLAPVIQLGSVYLQSKLGMPAAAAPHSARTPSDDAPSSLRDESAPDAEAPAETPVPERAPVADIGKHVLQIQAQLTADERSFVEGAIARLTISEMGQWQQQLARMSVADAVAAIRAEIAKSAKPAKSKSAVAPAKDSKNGKTIQEKVS